MSATEVVVKDLSECAQKKDFLGAFKLVKTHQEELSKNLRIEGIKDLLKKTTDDRLLLSFIDGSDFGLKPLDKVLVSLEKLISFVPGSWVINDTWGLGEVKKIDVFYKRIVVDFQSRKGHQFTYRAAADVLVSAPENHILMIRRSDPVRFETLLKEEQGEFVKLVLKSYGDMSIVRLEDVFVKNGFVKATGWKKFWEQARATLCKDHTIHIPAKRTEPITIKETAENYGDNYLMALSHETDAKLIYMSVKEYVAKKSFETIEEDVKAKIIDRLSFAIAASRRTDDALYAKIGSLVLSLGITEISVDNMRKYLWEGSRFQDACKNLPARDLNEFLRFMAEDDQSRKKIYSRIGFLSYNGVCEAVRLFGEDHDCREAIAKLLRDSKVPAQVTTLVIGKFENFSSWEELPSFLTILNHAIVLCEIRQSGENLRMKNIVGRLFQDKNWLAKVFDWLPDDESRIAFFERFQASMTWDAASHRTIIVRMTHVCPLLAKYLVSIERKKEYARVTSPRSYSIRKAEYLKLINEDMPQNVKNIEIARGYGDLSENAEYQYAKDEQRALMQKQSVMQEELELIKESDFSDATTDEVMPGVTVKFTSSAGDKTYTILGEWDNDEEFNVISSKSRLAENMLGKKVGDKFELPGHDVVELATIVEISPLTQSLRTWMMTAI